MPATRNRPSVETYQQTCPDIVELGLLDLERIVEAINCLIVGRRGSLWRRSLRRLWLGASFVTCTVVARLAVVARLVGRPLWLLGRIVAKVLAGIVVARSLTTHDFGRVKDDMVPRGKQMDHKNTAVEGVLYRQQTVERRGGGSKGLRDKVRSGISPRPFQESLPGERVIVMGESCADPVVPSRQPRQLVLELSTSALPDSQ